MLNDISANFLLSFQADGNYFWCEHLSTQNFCLLRFMWKWRTKQSVLALLPQAKATSTWMPSWKPLEKLGPKLWVWMGLSAAAVSDLESRIDRICIKKKKITKKDWIFRSCLVHVTWVKCGRNRYWKSKAFEASGKAGGSSCRWLLDSEITPGSSFSSFPNMLGEEKKSQLVLTLSAALIPFPLWENKRKRKCTQTIFALSCFLYFT